MDSIGEHIYCSREGERNLTTIIAFMILSLYSLQIYRVHSSNYSDLRKKLLNKILFKVEQDQKEGPTSGAALWRYAKAAVSTILLC